VPVQDSFNMHALISIKQGFAEVAQLKK